MKLPEHVEKLRILIENAFDNQFLRLGLGKSRIIDADSLPEELRPKRQRFELMLNNHISETGDYASGREKLIDELTFTLFNRFAALKVMEAANLFPPILTKHPQHGNRSFGHKQWLEIRPDMRNEELEGIREYIKYAFDELGESLPLYNRSYPYALLPDTIRLNEIIDAFNAVEKDEQIGNEIWQNYDVMGWMYESYNNAKKAAFKDSGAKAEYNKISLQSQVYTPRWVVQFLVENSLGKLYLEMYPESKIKDRYKIANAPNSRSRDPKPLHELKLIDPACGSGNFLLYAFDLFYEFYLDQIENYGADYNEADIPKLIIENNLHGIDIDDRAVQLAQLGLFIKAKKKQRTIGELKFKVVSSDFFLPEYKEVQEIFESQFGTNGHQLDDSQKELIRNIWSDLQYAYKFGSLIRVGERLNAKLKELEAKQKQEQQKLTTYIEIEDHKVFASKFFENLKTVVEQYTKTKGNSFLTSKTHDAITFLEILTTEHNVATTNPPYTDSADFGPELKAFIESNYKMPYKFHTNLYATFIKRCYEMTDEYGKIAMIHPHTFMFIKTFEDVRKFMIEKTRVDAMVDYGLDRVNLFGPGILLDGTFYVLSKEKSEKAGLYFNLTTNLQEKFKKGKFLEALDNYIAGISNDRIYTLEQSKLKIIKSWPFIYWISDEFREQFRNVELSDLVDACKGMDTSNNIRFIRFWWEISEKGPIDNWKVYAKGGPFEKWYGNLWTIINWDNDGHEVKAFPKSTIRNKQYFFTEGLTYSTSGSKGASFRYLPSGSIFDAGGNGLFVIDKDGDLFYLLAFMNSKLGFYIRDCLNPTVNTTVGDLNRLPLIIRKEYSYLQDFARMCVSIKKYLTSFSFIEFDYQKSPFLLNSENSRIKERINSFLNYENYLLTQVLINEAIIDEKIFEVYDLTEHDKAMVLAKEGESIGDLPVDAEAKEAYLTDKVATKEFPLDNIREYIEALPIKEFTIEERENIESGFLSLYQNNNDLEEFCIRNQVNPINVWYWFKQSNIIPEQRMHTLAMGFLADMIRDILMEDTDGMIPLVPNAGEKILLDRIEQKFIEKGFSMAQYSSFDSLLGRSLNEYLNKYFFAELSDHLNLFMYLPKTPFIWHLSSGPEQGFDCYIIIYKWSRDKLMRLRSVYIEHRERALINRQSDLANNDSPEAQAERDLISKQLREIEAFKVKIDELLSEGYDPILDDGVGKNIAPLQKKKMISYDVLNAGQLKKYLNADW